MKSGGFRKLTQKQKEVAMAIGLKRFEEYKKEVYNVTPSIYASLALAMFDLGADPEDIEYLFSESQKIWENFASDPRSMAEMCLEKTGIDVQYKDTI